MKKIINLIGLWCLLSSTVLAQFADPAVTGANFVPNSINVGQTSTLTISFSNTGFSDIPAGSIELTISTASTYYTTDGTTVPSGTGGALFNWVYLGVDTWRGTNINAIPAFGGGDITLQVTGNAVAPSFEVTNINVQPVNSFGSFANAPSNDNLQPELNVTMDTDGDGIPNITDLDDDNDGILDTDEDATADNGGDTDLDGIPDPLDLDSDNDGINDVIEAGGTDADLDGQADGAVGTTPTTNGIPASAGTGLTPPDADNDGNPDFQEIDSDGDGTFDIVNSDNPNLDGNNDGIIDDLTDPDMDGIVGGADGLPNEFGDALDTDGDGISDVDDLDDDNDGIPDTVELLTASNGGDTDGDGIPDNLDLDSDNDGINDVIEAGGTDTNDDGQADGTVGTSPTTNGIPSSAGTGLNPPNTDGVGAPDFQDLDADDDGISDLVESGQDPAVVDTDDNGVVDAGPDADQDGIQDVVDGDTGNFGDSGSPDPQDSDNDNIPDYQDLDSDDPTNTIGDGNDDIDDSGNGPLDGDNDGQVDPTVDADNDGIDDGIDEDLGVFGGLGSPDTDGDGIPNDEDLDDDNDGIPDTVELLTASNGGDTDGDGIPDNLDLDSDNDGINDVIEAGGTDNDNNGIADGAVGTTPTTNGIPSSAGTNGTGLVPPNTDGTGAPDFQDLDADGDSVPDLVESGNPALVDNDNDGQVDGTDPDRDGILGTADGSPTYGDANDPTPQNTDGDGNFNFQDPDDDGDGVPTIDEDTNDNGDPTDDDTDGDGTDDYLDADPFVRLHLRVFLQGSYNLGTGLMRDDLRSQGVIPTTEPYTGFGFTHVGGGGGETVNSDVFNITGANAITDWVVLELRDKNTPSTVIATRSALVQRDGDVVDLDGVSVVTFLGVALDNYYVAIKHRNHLGVMTDVAVALNQDIRLIDFTTTTQNNFKLSGAFGSDYAQTDFNGSSVRALWAGNVDFNDRVIFQGTPVDQDGIFFGVLLDPDNTNLAANYIQDGYNQGDVNMDGTAIFQGSPNDTDIIFFNVVGHPENVNFLANFIVIQQIP